MQTVPLQRYFEVRGKACYLFRTESLFLEEIHTFLLNNAMSSEFHLFYQAFTAATEKILSYYNFYASIYLIHL